MAKQSKSTRGAGEVKAAYAEHFKAGQSPQPTDFAQLIDDSFCAHELLSNHPAEPHQGLGWQPDNKIHAVTTGGIQADADQALAVNISPRMKIGATSGNLDGKQWFGVEDFYSLSRSERNELAQLLGLSSGIELRSPASALFSCSDRNRIFVRVESTDFTGTHVYILNTEGNSKNSYLFTDIRDAQKSTKNSDYFAQVNGNVIYYDIHLGYYFHIKHCSLDVKDNEIIKVFYDNEIAVPTNAAIWGYGVSLYEHNNFLHRWFRAEHNGNTEFSQMTARSLKNSKLITTCKSAWLPGNTSTGYIKMIPSKEEKSLIFLYEADIYRKATLDSTPVKLFNISGGNFGFSHNDTAAVKRTTNQMVFYNLQSNWSSHQIFNYNVSSGSYSVVCKNFMSPSGNAAFCVEGNELTFFFKTGSSWNSTMKIKKEKIFPRPPEGKKIIAAELQDTAEGGAFLYYTYEDSLELYFIEVKGG